MKKIYCFLNILFFSLLLCFVSCSNPVANTELPSVRSAKTSNLLVFDVEAFEECGTTDPEGEVSYKVGNSYDIVFSEKDGYQFDKWEVVNKETGKVITDVISIADKSEAETSITILRSADNVLLRALAKKRPESVSTMPSYKDDGVYCDSIIIVTFNSKISEDSFCYTQEDLAFLTYDKLLKTEDGKAYGYIFNGETYFKNIFISSSDDKNLLKYYNPPVLENGTILKIKPKNDMPLVTTTGNLLDIDVIISPDVYDENKVSLGGEGVQWRYRVNSNTDKIPPEFTTFELKYKDVKLVPDAKFNSSNYVQDKLSYNFNGVDKESGINFMQIEAKRIQTADGVNVDEEPVVSIINKTSGQGILDLQNQDGLIQLTFSLYDFSGNVSKKNQTYLVAKDTAVDTSEIYFYNRYDYQDDEIVFVQDLEKASKEIFWKNSKNDIWAKDKITAAENLSYELFWSNEKDKFTQSIKCTKEQNFKDGLWSCIIPEVNSSQNTYLRLQVTDALGNKGFSEAFIPAVPTYFTYQKMSKEGENPAHYRIFYADSKENEANALFLGYLFYSEEAEGGLKTKIFITEEYDETSNSSQLKTSRYADLYLNDISKCRFYFQLAGVTDKSILLSNVYNFSIIESKDKTAPAVQSITIEKGKNNSGKNIATVKYASEPTFGSAYNLFWGKSPDSLINYVQAASFEIDSDINKLYYKTVYVDEKSGASTTGDVLSYDLSNQMFDTTSPYVKNLQCVCAYQKFGEYTANEYYPIINCNICYDTYEVLNGKAEYVLYTVPVDSVDTAFEDISEEQIKTSPCVVNTFVPPKNPGESVMVWNNIEGVSSADNYFYVIYLEDAAGNYSYHPLSFNKQLLKNIPLISFSQNKEDSNIVDITFKIEKEQKCRNYQIQYSIYNEDNSQEGFVLCSDITENKYDSNAVLTLKDNVYSAVVQNQKDSFYFGFAKALYQTKSNEILKYTYPVYFYTGLGESVECSLKEIIDDMNGAQIYCDRPCLVMTYWSSENYEYSVEAWEAYGVQSNPMYISAQNPVTNKYEDTFKFYKINRESIPMGKYYVVIAHFADGTSKISRTINTN